MDPLDGDGGGRSLYHFHPAASHKSLFPGGANLCIVLVAEPISPASYPMPSIIRRTDGDASIANQSLTSLIFITRAAGKITTYHAQHNSKRPTVYRTSLALTPDGSLLRINSHSNHQPSKPPSHATRSIRPIHFAQSTWVYMVLVAIVSSLLGRN
jgi:hypothetical protein